MKYRMPTKSCLSQRRSTIANAFSISITPYVKPNSSEVLEQYKILHIHENQCAYCLGYATTVDHFRPLVENGLPTGYITNIKNLVPCCNSCNSSKGGKYWKDWYLSENNIKKLKEKGFTDNLIEERCLCLEKFEALTNDKLDYKSILGEKKWTEFLERKKRLIELLIEDQKFCDELYSEIIQYLKVKN